MKLRKYQEQNPRRETKPDRRQILLHPLIERGKSKALSTILKIFEGPESPEKNIVLGFYTLAIEPGCEAVLKTALASNKPEVIRVAHESLLQLCTEEARKILEEAHKAGKISTIEIKD